jgi:broad specificity phosphatase PhoE
MTECWLVRHGESTWNSAGRFQGSQDAPLSARGRAQAGALAERLRTVGFDALYTSPLRRAHDTAAACRAALGLEPVPVAELREVGLGAWEGLTLDAVRAHDGERYRRWLAAPVDCPAPGGEPMVGLARRVQAALDALCRRHVGGRVLVVSHGGAIASVLCAWLGRPLNEMWTVRVDNASITRVRIPTGRVLGLNDTGHLVGAAAAPGAP